MAVLQLLDSSFLSSLTVALSSRLDLDKWINDPPSESEEEIDAGGSFFTPSVHASPITEREEAK